MKNRKGFTLTELLVVIAMIAVIGTVIIANTISLNNRAKDSEYDRMVENIQNAAKTYVSLYPDDFGELYSSKAFTYIPLLQIVHAGLLEEEIINPYTNKQLDFNDKKMGFIKVYVDGDSYEMVYKYPLTDDDYNTQMYLVSNAISAYEDNEEGFKPVYLYEGIKARLADVELGISNEQGDFVNPRENAGKSLLDFYKEEYNLRAEISDGSFEKCSDSNSKCDDVILESEPWRKKEDFYIPSKTGTFEIKYHWSYVANGTTIQRTDTRMVKVYSSSDREKNRVSTSAVNTTSGEITTVNADGMIYRLTSTDADGNVVNGYNFNGNVSMSSIPLMMADENGNKKPFTIYMEGVISHYGSSGYVLIDHNDSGSMGFKLKFSSSSLNLSLETTNNGGSFCNGENGTLIPYKQNKTFRMIIYYDPSSAKDRIYYKMINNVDDGNVISSEGSRKYPVASSDKVMYIGGNEDTSYQSSVNFKQFIVFNRADASLINRSFD